MAMLACQSDSGRLVGKHDAQQRSCLLGHLLQQQRDIAHCHFSVNQELHLSRQVGLLYKTSALQQNQVTGCSFRQHHYHIPWHKFFRGCCPADIACSINC
jgi:hypothetical protein